ncbi:hypothetical protein [Dactylosporangium sp. CA-092794]
MFTETVAWWLAHDRPGTPEEIAGRSARMAAAIITEATGWPAAPETVNRR